MLEPNDTGNPVNSPENPKNQQDDSALQAGCLVSTLAVKPKIISVILYVVAILAIAYSLYVLVVSISQAVSYTDCLLPISTAIFFSYGLYVAVKAKEQVSIGIAMGIMIVLSVLSVVGFLIQLQINEIYENIGSPAISNAGWAFASVAYILLLLKRLRKLRDTDANQSGIQPEFNRPPCP